MIRTRLVPLILCPALLAACNGGGAAVQQAAAAPDTPAGRPAPPPVDVPAPPPPCAPEDGGITLPEGFCALVVADGLTGVRHVAVAPNGDVYGALSGRRGADGGVVALRDTTGDGRADVTARFGDAGGTGIAVRDGWLYFAPNDGVVRWRIPPGGLAPTGAPETLVTGLPTGGHTAKSLAFDGRGGMLVTVGSQSNACQERDRQAGSPGQEPCAELATRAGHWRFDADRPGQTQADGVRWTTGIRNGMAVAWNPRANAAFAVSHGRDQLTGWPGFSAEDNAELPTEEMFRLDRGMDGGWPYCYHDPRRGKVLAPEYGGDGQQAGRCADAAEPVAAYPAHWAPNALLFYDGQMFPDRYRGGAFIAFHGSWNRAPLPQQGYNVVFQPFAGGAPSGDFEVFADGFAGGDRSPRGAEHRPTGLAQGPDGSLYVSDDAGGRIWRIVYTGAR